MSYTFLLARGGESSAECFSDIPACALSRLNLTASRSSCSANGMESFPGSRSGTMSEPSTEDRGAVTSTSLPVASHAKESVRPATATDSNIPKQDFGQIWRVPFAKWDRDSSSWKTPHSSLFEELNEFSVTWPRWGMMRNGECSGLATPLGVQELRSRITKGLESGFLRYPTPRANDGEKRGNFDTQNPRNGLAAFVRRYPTPCASDADKWNHMTAEKRKAKGQHLRLCNVLRSELGEPVGGLQNPEFTEWLMGWPIGWTDLEPLATAKFQQWLHSHGRSSAAAE